MAFTLKIPAHILRRTLAGTITAAGAGIAYHNGTTFEDISRGFESFPTILKASGITQLKVADIYKLLTSRDPSSISNSLALQLASDPQIVDYLWSTYEHSDISLLPSVVHVLNSQDELLTAQLLSRAPSLDLLHKLIGKESHGSWFSCFEFDARFQNPPLHDPESLVACCKGGDELVPSELLFFVLTHSSSIRSHLSREDVLSILETCINNVLVDLVRYRKLLLRLIDSYYDYFMDSERVKILLPILIRLLRSNGVLNSPDGPLIMTTCTKLISAVPNLDMQSSSILPSLIDLSENASSDNKQLVLRLILALKQSSPKMKIPSPDSWINDYFTSSAVDERTLLDLIACSLPTDESEIHSVLATCVSCLERRLQLTDYESTQKKIAVVSTRDRPIVDTDLYAFHEEEGESDEPPIPSSNTLESLIERLGILSEIARRNQDSVAGEFFTSVVFSLLISLGTENTWKVLANISSLGKMVSLVSRDRMTKLSQDLKRPESTVSSRAELARLDHNIKCLPIKSAPLLVDSLLPLDDSNTPLDPDFDIIFVHGLRGGLKTWRYEGEESGRLWPAECLGPSFPGARLLAFTFDAPLWFATHKQHYSEVEVAKNFAEMSESLRDALRDAGVGNGRKVIFVCFSMGGLVVKRALVDDESLRDNTEGVVFFGTPHLGSPIADYAHYTPFVTGSLVSSFVADLSRKSKQVLTLHDSFIECSEKIPSLSICETAQTDLGAGLKGMIVPLDSCSACGNRPGNFVLEAAPGTDHEQVSKINPDLTEKDPRVVALINFIHSIRE